MSSQPGAQLEPAARFTFPWLALGITLALAAFWIATLPSSHSLGWDESMHAWLPAARMATAAHEGDSIAGFDALLGCGQYPFVVPLYLAWVQILFGIGEHVCRVAVLLLWCGGLFGLFLLGREIARRVERESRGRLQGLELLPWCAFALGALSPLAVAFSGTLFLETSFTALAIWALRAWLRRDGTRSRELAAGAWITAALFVKFNYGLLLIGGLGLDTACEAFIELRGGSGRAFTRRIAWLALIPTIVCLWWFVLPIPGGAVIAHDHREALLAFLGGNIGFEPTPYALRLLHAALYLAPTPRWLAAELALALVALCWIRLSTVRVLACVLVACALPPWLHPFHLDRFLVPQALGLWLLAAMGTAMLLARLSRGRAPAALALGALLFIGGFDRDWLAARLVAPADAKVANYQHEIFARWRELGAARDLPTNSLERAEFDALASAIVAEAKPDERAGWIGISSQLSPAAFELARLVAPDGSRATFLRDAPRTLDVGYFADDPHWSNAELAHFAEGFDVIFTCEPPNLRERHDRAWTAGYAKRLVEELGWQKRELARIPIARSLREPLVVVFYACRPIQ